MAGLFRSRGLTDAEISISRCIFGDAIEYEFVTLICRKWFVFQPRNVLMAPNGHIWFHPDGHLWREDFGEAPLSSQAHFIHEMTHVWQHQQGVNLIFKRHPFCSYDYKLVPDQAFENYGIEQQAEIVRHAFMLQQGVRLAGKPPLDHYRAILPFRPFAKEHTNHAT